MCGRYRIKDKEALSRHLRDTFGISDWDQATPPRYNIAPSQDCPTITLDDEGNVLPVPCSMRWGYVPFWDKSDKPKLAPINAKSEGIATNGMFRQSLQRRRCLVPADGFYEWLRLDEKTRIPFDIHLKGGRPFLMGAIYENATPTRPATFAILTTAANSAMAHIHDRMPVIFEPDAAKRWLKPGPIALPELAALTAPVSAEETETVSISSLVNSPRNDTPEILTPVAFTPAPPKETQAELF